MEVDMFIPEIQLAKHLIEERLKEAERQRLIRIADLAAKSGQQAWSRRLLAWSGDRLVDLGSYLQLRAGNKSSEMSGCPSACMVQA
jgi:hypothetical protein